MIKLSPQGYLCLLFEGRKSDFEMKSLSQLLLPVADMDMCLAAIHNGADAIYVGVPGFNARGRTDDFSLEELKQIIDMCHLYDVDVHLAFNIVIFENELMKAKDLLLELIPLHPDAFIVQDLGLARLIRMICPDQTIHASTQMTVTDDLIIKELEDLNIQCFVLARENSLLEIKKIRQNTNKELEVFVHGALCVSFSGQCFTSESLGGRSANRGQCAQSCRFEYEMFVDGAKKDISTQPFIVGPRDLLGLEHVQELQEIGIDCLKVEGRLKGPEYVAMTARYYKDKLLGKDIDIIKARFELEKAFSRGFHSGWLKGIDHQNLVEGSYTNHHGPEIGTVQKMNGKNIYLKADVELQLGMGLLFKSPHFEVGGHIYHIEKDSAISSDLTCIRLSNDFDLSSIKLDMRVFLNKDPQLEKKWSITWKDKNLLKSIPISIKVTAKFGSPFILEVTDQTHYIEITGKSPLEKSEQHPLDLKFLESFFSKLSHTPYILKCFEGTLESNLFLHNKELKLLKKEMIEKLNQKRVYRKPKKLNNILHEEIIFSTDSKCEIHSPTERMTPDPNKAFFHLLIRNIEQLQLFLKNLEKQSHFKERIKTITLDYEFGKDYAPSIHLIKEQKLSPHLATTRILKPEEHHNLKHLVRLNPDGYLIRNLGALHFLKNHTSQKILRGDFSLNATNHLSVQYLLDKGLNLLCPSYDLNQSQLLDLIKSLSPHIRLEITLQQYMPEFHMEYCVFAKYLSNGKDFKDCGRPCEKHRIELKDFYGNYHFLTADQECRNTFFQAKLQGAPNLLMDWMNAGVSDFRMEALLETGNDFFEKFKLYCDYLDQKLGIEKLRQKLAIGEKYGLDSGQLLKTDQYKNRKL